jgi:hypothetical protein
MAYQHRSNEWVRQAVLETCERFQADFTRTGHMRLGLAGYTFDDDLPGWLERQLVLDGYDARCEFHRIGRTDSRSITVSLVKGLSLD